MTQGDMAIAGLLDTLFDSGASDLILSAHTAPALRRDGRISLLSQKPLKPADTEQLIDEVLTDQQRAVFASEHAVDFAFQWRDRGRLRGNAFRQRGSAALALRALPGRIPDFQELRLPDVCRQLVTLPHGLILVTGPTGSGKSTTQASMVDVINADRAAHIITIEDPIEYMHSNLRSVVEQREVLVDTPSFASALRSALREDPDVILVGELRDLESIRMALTIAETGHLVIATLHTNDAAQAVSRVVDVFSAEQQQQIRVQLAAALAAVIHQELLPRIGGGRVAAFEVLVATYPARSLIRENKTGQLRNIIATSGRDGMQTLEQSLNGLIASGLVDFEEAALRSVHAGELKRPIPVADLVQAPAATGGANDPRQNGNTAAVPSPPPGAPPPPPPPPRG